MITRKIMYETPDGRLFENAITAKDYCMDQVRDYTADTLKASSGVMKNMSLADVYLVVSALTENAGDLENLHKVLNTWEINIPEDHDRED